MQTLVQRAIPLTGQGYSVTVTAGDAYVIVLSLHHEATTVIGTDPNGLLAAGPDLAGYQFTIRLAGFCRTKTGVWRVKYKAAGTCRKFKFISLFLDFCHYHVELHNKIVFTCLRSN